MRPSVFGTGYSDIASSYDAGHEAARKAMDQAGLQKDEPDLCMLFCTSRHDAAEFEAGVRSVTGTNTCLFGGYANGTCTNTQMGYDGYQTAVGVLRSDTIRLHFYLQEGLAFNEYETGKGLANQIAETTFGSDPSVLVLFDAVNRQEGSFRMNYGAPFLKGMKEILGNWPRMAGARMLGDMKFKPTHQWVKNVMTQNSALALAMSGSVRMDTQVMHGCKPASAYHKVTATKGANILEIDGQPALEFVNNILGPELKGKYQEIKYFVTLGKNIGDKWGDFKPSNYINRMCVGVDVKSNGLFMAEMDFEPGTEIQLMRRSFEMDYVGELVTGLIKKVKDEGRRPLFALYLNCAGRAASYSENTDEDVRHVQKAINNEFPLIGMYEAGELAVVGGDLQVLDWTGIFCLFSETGKYE
jgi:hypothetical protein